MILFHSHSIHEFLALCNNDKFFGTSAVLESVCVKYYVLPNTRAVNPDCQQSSLFEENIYLNNRMDLGLSRASEAPHRWVFRYSFQIPQKLKIHVQSEPGEWRQCCRILGTRSSIEGLTYEGKKSLFLWNVWL